MQDRNGIVESSSRLVNGDVVLESGDYAFKVDRAWAKLPAGWSFREVAAAKDIFMPQLW